MNLEYTSGQASVNGGTAFQVRRSVLVLFFFGMYVIGAHLRISIYSGDSMIVPMYLMLLGAGMVGLLYLPALLKKVGPTFAVFVLFIMLQPVLTGAPNSGLGSDITGKAQFLVSVAGSLALLAALSKIERPRLRKFALVTWAVFIFLAYLESIALKPVFDAVRESLYAGSDRGVYDSIDRDLQIYGKIRTTVFASEPSFLADTLGSLILMIFLLSPKPGSVRSWIELGAMLAVSFTVAPSFKLAFYLAAGAVWVLWPSTRERAKIILLLIASLVSIYLLFGRELVMLYFRVFGDHLDGGSYFGRVVAGPLVAAEAIQRFPLWGFGVANDDGVYPIVAHIWQSTGALSAFPWYAEGSAKNLMSSGFYWQIVYLGIAGVIVFVSILRQMLLVLGVIIPMRTIICTWIVWYGGAAFVDPQSWFPVVIFGLGAMASGVRTR